MKKILTVYYSWLNLNTERIEKTLHRNNFNGKTMIPFMTNGGWLGRVIIDMKATCKGANITCEMQIQFDSEGWSNLVTPMEQIEQWIENVKCVL